MKKAALVLSGGAALGAAHIGALKVLEQKYEFDFLIGVSAGAIVAAAHACGKTAAQISQVLQEMSLFQLVFDFSPQQFGIVQGKKVLALLRDMFQERRFEDLAPGKKLLIGATDFQTGERVLISSGSIAEAVRASVSVPVLFEPFWHQGSWLVDGFLSQNFPLDIALEEYVGETIIAIDVGTSIDLNFDFAQKKFFGTMRNARKLLDRMMRIMLRQQQNFPPDDRVTLIRPELQEFTTASIHKLSEIEHKGEEAVQQLYSPN